MTTADLDFIHRWVPAPDDSNAVKTLLLLHGTGGDEDDLLPLGQILDPAANLLSLRGKVLENGMPRFFRRLAEGVFDIPDLIRRTGELAAFLPTAAQRYGFDPQHVTAVGFSNGANIAAALLLLHPGVIKSTILFHAMVPLTPDTPPKLTGTHVFLGAGRQDHLATPADTEALAELLRTSGADVTIHWHAGGHSLSHEEVQAASQWLREDQAIDSAEDQAIDSAIVPRTEVRG